VLNASGSIGRGSNIVSYEWDYTTPINFSPVDATGVTTNQTAYFSSQPSGTYNVGLRVTDDVTPTPQQVINYTTLTINQPGQCVNLGQASGVARLISKKRVTASTSDNTYQLTLTNQGMGNATNVVAQLASSQTNVISISDGSVTFASIGAGATQTGGDTFTIRVNQSTAPTILNWTFTYSNGTVTGNGTFTSHF
jgi:hypothetical protein